MLTNTLPLPPEKQIPTDRGAVGRPASSPRRSAPCSTTPASARSSTARTLPEHFDVVVVGAGLSGIGAGYHLQTDVPRPHVRDPRRARRHRRHVGPVPLSRRALRQRHAHARLQLQAVDRREVDRRRAVDPAPTSARPPPRTASIGTSASTITSTAPRGRARTPGGRSRASTPRMATTVDTHVRLPVHVRRATTATRRGYTPEFPGIERFEGTVVHPQFWPDDLDYARQARRRHRLGGDGDDARAGDGATPPPTSRCCSARPRTSSPGPTRTRSPTGCASCCPTRSPTGSRAGRTSPCAATSTAGRAPSPAKIEGRLLLGVVRKQLGDGLRRRHPLHPDATTRGTSACAWSPTATCSTAIRSGKASVVTDTIDDVHAERNRARVRRRARGRHHRHRDRAAAGDARRDGLRRRRRAGRLRRDLDVQGLRVLATSPTWRRRSATSTPRGRCAPT